MNGRPNCTTVQNGWLAAFACTFHNGYFNELNSFMTIEVASFDIRYVWSLLYCTAWPNGMSHRKWRETKQQLISLPYLALLGFCLVSLNFLCDIPFGHAVDTLKWNLSGNRFSLV